MTKEQREKLENCLLNCAERISKEATTAEEAEALAAVALALNEIGKD